jgi:arginyl-tRNA synthetase
MLSQKLQVEVAKAAHKHYQCKSSEVAVEPTRDLAHGDLMSNIALRVASKWGVPVQAAANTILADLRESRTVQNSCFKVEMAGPGFINFYVKPAVLIQQLPDLTKPAARALYRGERVIVEFSSPNIAKPMHVGHIRSTIIGAALANIFEALGAKVYRINHLGDWGTQFGKLIAAYKKWGNREQIKKAPIFEMLRLYVKFHEEMKLDPELERQGQQEFLKLEKGDRQNKALWNWFRRESLQEFNKLYKRLGVKFSHVVGESYYESMLQPIITDLLRKKIASKNDDGSVVVHLDKEGLPPCLIQKSDGGSLYATRDLAAIRYRVKRFKPSQILYVVGNEQSLHFDQVFAVARRAGYSGAASLKHVKYGLILGEDKQKLATREGKIIPLDEVLNKANEIARQVVQSKNPTLAAAVKASIAEVVGVGAVKYNDLSQNRLTDITFNWEKMLALEGNSAPYLQYSYVRLKSVLRKSGLRNRRMPSPNVLSDATSHDLQVLRTLARYPEFLRRAAAEQGPHLLAAYLYELSNQVNTFYHAVPVIKAETKLRNLRLSLVETAASVLKQGLNILGIAVVEQM